MPSQRQRDPLEGRDTISRMMQTKDIGCVEIDNTFAAILGISEGQRVK